MRRLLDLMSNVWLGVFWAALMFIYCSIGSAVPSVRQLPQLEMTEFEWFHWWPFNVLVMLFCATLVLTTVRRIPLRLVNAGVWTIHVGIILLCAGSYYYFGTKVEGDTPVFRRRVRIEMPGLDKPRTFPALPGSGTSVLVGPDRWRFQVQGTNARWPILSEGYEGETAYAVNVRVTPPVGDSFVRQLLAGYPQFTEDVIPGQGRAVKSLGRKLVNEDLRLTLDYEPQKYFHIMKTWALFVRQVGESEWHQRPIESLPRYNDRIGSRDQVFIDPHHQVPLRAIDLIVPPSPDGDALASASVRITGYLRYAHMHRRWRGGGGRLNPVLRISVISDHANPQTHELVALDSVHNQSEDGTFEFRWFDNSSAVESLPTDSGAMLTVTVPDTDVKLSVPITAETLAGPDGPFTKIRGTDFSFRIRNVQDNLAIPTSGGTVSVAMVDIETPEGRFTRMVADPADMTRDMHGDRADPHSGGRAPGPPDPRVVMTYHPFSAPVILAAHPAGLRLVVNGPSGRMFTRDIAIGETVEVVPGASVRADALLMHAVSEFKPRIVSPSSRRRDAGESFAMIRLEVQSGHDVQAKWVPFNHYVFPNEQYAYAGRFSYTPEQFRLADGSVVEVLFSRQRRRLPNPIALEDFSLDAHVGGFTGQAITIRNYFSSLRFLDNGTWSEPTTIKVNDPTEFGGYWYFQSTWDRPPQDDPTGGMNYTGLGVGNRNGVYVQLAGCCIAVTGMMFAFYVKPVLKRRRAEQSRAKASGAAGAAVAESAATSKRETMQVASIEPAPVASSREK